MVMSPCKQCRKDEPTRHYLGCHSACPAYAAFTIAHMAEKRKMEEQKFAAVVQVGVKAKKRREY